MEPFACPRSEAIGVGTPAVVGVRGRPRASPAEEHVATLDCQFHSETYRQGHVRGDMAERQTR